MINAAANEENLQKLLAIKLGLPESQASDPREVAKFIESTPGGPNIYTRAKSLMTTTPTVMAAAKGGDTETTATTTPVEPDNVPTKTPEEMAKEEQDRIDAQNKAISDKSFTAASDPTSLVTKTPVTKVDSDDVTTQIDTNTGQITTTSPRVDTVQAQTTTTTDSPTSMLPSLATTVSGEDATRESVKDVAPVTTEVTDEALVDAVTKDPTKMTALGTDDIEQITSPTQVVAPAKRVIQEGEMISGSAVDMAAVKEATDIEAATANPSKKATVKGQLDDLMDDFDDGATPAWAAGAMRAATAAMAARGLGASSMAGQAIVQATMESALPIAQQDASTAASFEAQNLSNRQQTAMFAAEQRAKFLEIDFNQEFQTRVTNAARVSDIANINFTADQQIALENARLTQTANLANMSAVNAKVMADAAAMSQMDLTNLSNEQQAAVQNASSFLQVDMANLANEQQTELFKAQSVQQAILSDVAASNATSQFNASSKNQVDQFMASLKSQVDQFNVTQQNAMNQFNAGEENALEKFNSELANQREQFNASTTLVIAQANAKWRQDLATMNTAAQNDANKLDAAAMNNLTEKAIDDIWQRERDIMAWAVATSESASQRALDILLADKKVSTARENLAFEESASKSQFYSNILFGRDGLDLSNVVGNILN